MVAIVSGFGNGLSNSSSSVLGQNGLFGNAATGNSREGIFVNVANGNLALSDKDDFVASAGINLALSRTYNSQGSTADVGAFWSLGVRKQVTLSGTLNTAGSYLTRVDGDGAASRYDWDATRSAYVTTSGGGAYQSIVLDTSKNQWVWREGRSDTAGLTEYYDAANSGRIVKVADETGRGLTYSYGGDGKLSQITDAAGDITKFNFTGGNLSSISTRVQGASFDFTRVSYTYDGQNRLSKVTVDLTPDITTDAKVYTTTYTYVDTSNRVATIAQSDGTFNSFTYQQIGGVWKVATVTDALAHVTKFDYSLANKTTVTDPLNNKTTYTYDALGQLIQVDQPGGLTTQFFYDAKGNVFRTVDPRGLETIATYDAFGNQTQVRDSTGLAIERTYDPTGSKLLTEATVTLNEFKPLVNSSFSNGLTGWTVPSGVFASSSNGVLMVSGGNGQQWVSQQLTNLEVGRQYTLSWAAKADTPENGKVYVGVAGPGAGDLVQQSVGYPGEYRTYSATFTATATTAFVSFQASENQANYKDISFAPTNPSNILPNGDFSAGGAGWSVSSDGRVAPGSPSGVSITSAYFGAYLGQTVTGLEVGKTYRFSVIGSVSEQGSISFRSVNDSGQVALNTTEGSSTIEFTAQSSTINLTISVPTGSALIKSVSLTQLNTTAGQPNLISNGAFNSDLAGWTITQFRGGNAYWSGGSMVLTAEGTVDGSGQATWGLARALQGFTTIPGQRYEIALNIKNNPSHLSYYLGSSQYAGDLGSGSFIQGQNSISFVATSATTYLTFAQSSESGDYVEYRSVIDDVSVKALVTPQVLPLTTRTVHAVTRHVYDSLHRLRFDISTEGHVTEYRYDAQYNRTVIDYTGTNKYDTSSLSYDSSPTESAMMSWVTSASVDRSKSMRTDYIYDARGLLVRSLAYPGINADGSGAGVPATTIYTYDQAGQLLTRIDPDQVAKGAGGRATAYTYDGLGRLRTTTDTTGVITTTDYDDANNTVVTYLANGLVRSSVFDKAGMLTAVTESNGGTPLGTTRYTYDQDGRLCMTVDPAGQRAFKLYDAVGRLVGDVDGDGTLTEYFYNANSQVSRTRTYATRVSVKSLLDASGTYLFKTIDSIRPAETSIDRSTWNTYDNIGRLYESVDGEGALTRRIYDGMSRVTQLVRLYNRVDLSALATVKVPTSFVSTASPENDRIARNFYDGDGKLLGSLDPEGFLTENVYDTAGQLLETIQYEAATPVAQRTGKALADVRPPVGTATTRTHFLYDVRGRQIGAIDGKGYLTETVYSPSGNVLKRTLYGATVNWTPTATLATLRPSVAHPDDRSTSYTYDALNRVATMTAPDKSVTSYTYDGAGNLLSQSVSPISGPAASQQYHFDAQGNVIGELSELGASMLTPTNSAEIWRDYGTSYTYDGAGNRTSMKDAAGNRTLYYYDGDGRLAYTVDALGSVRGATYNAFGEKESTIAYSKAISAAELASLSGGVIGDAFATTISQLATPGKDTIQTYAYDRNGRVKDQVDGMGFHVLTSYNVFGEATLVTAPNGSLQYSPGGSDIASRIFYDKDGRIAATLNTAGIMTTFRYDGSGRVLEKLTYANPLPIGNDFATITLADLKPYANVLRDQHQRFYYDARGLLETTLTATGVSSANVQQWSVTKQSYDNAGNLVSRTEYAKKVDSADVSGLIPPAVTPSSASDASQDAVTRYFYDGMNRVVATAAAIKQNTWAITQTRYDGAGRVIMQRAMANSLMVDATASAVTDFLNANANQSKSDQITLSAYDSAGQLIATAKAASDDNWQVTRYAYNKLGQQVVRTKLGNLAMAVLDPATVTADAINGLSAFTGTVTGTQNAETRYAYDSLGRLAVTVNAVGMVESYRYDNKGNLTATIRYKQPYVASGELPSGFTPAITAGQDQVVQAVYDNNGRKVLSVNAEGEAVKYEYDGLGNVITKVEYATRIGVDSSPNSTPVVIASANDRITRYVYDMAGRLAYTIDNEGYITATSYDSFNRVTDTYEFVSPRSFWRFDYKYMKEQVDPMIAIPSYSAGAPRITHFDYDAKGNLITRRDPTGASEAFEYDAIGRRIGYFDKIGVQNNKQARFKWTYEFDALGREISATSPAVDVYSNGLYVEGGTWTAPARYDNKASSIKTLTVYDAFGNVSSRTEAANIVGQSRTTGYRYDRMGRLIQTILPSFNAYNQAADSKQSVGQAARTESSSGVLTIDVKYDAFGNAIRVRNLDDSDVSERLFDKEGRVIFERDALGYLTEYRRDSFGNVVEQVRYSTQYSTSLNQVSAENVRSAMAGRGVSAAASDRVTKYTYFRTGQLRSVIEPRTKVFDQHALQGGDGMLDSALTTVTEYDAFGAVTKVESFGADANGNPVTEKAGTYSFYNSRGQKTATVTAVAVNLGYLTTFAYDQSGNVLETIEYADAISNWSSGPSVPTYNASRDRKTTYTYDRNDRLLTQTKYTSYADSADPDLTRNNITTTFTYDAMGRQVSMVDQLGTATYSYYDELGRVKAVVKLGTTGKSQLTEYKLDAYGNVLLQSARINGVTAASASAYTAGAVSVDDQVTAYSYDAAGHALQEVDAAGVLNHVINYSYDKFGRVAKQWRTVTSDGLKQTVFEIRQYDALGRIAHVIKPGNLGINDDPATTNKLIDNETQYTAFGEVRLHVLNDENGRYLIDQFKYDNAGNAWFTNEGDGVEKIRLFDAHGRLTSEIRSTGDNVHLLDRLSAAQDVLSEESVLRTDTRRDLQGNVVDVSVIDNYALLHRNSQTGEWQKLHSTAVHPEDLLIVAGQEDRDNKVTVFYRLKGESAWIDGSSRVARVDGYTTLNFSGLQSGDYEYRSEVQVGSEPVFERTKGSVTISSLTSNRKAERIIQLYTVLFNRLPDGAGLNYWIDRSNKVVTMGALVGFMLTGDEGRQRLAESGGKGMMALIFRDGLRLPQEGEYFDAWNARYNNAVTDADRGQVVIDLLEQIYIDAGKKPSQQLISNRTAAGMTYVVGYKANKESSLRALFDAAGTGDLANAGIASLELANRLAAADLRTEQIAQIYVATLGRPPMQAESQAELASERSMDQLAAALMASAEARNAKLYVLDATTAQGKELIAKRVVKNMLGREATAAEISKIQQQLAARTPGQVIADLAMNVASTGTIDQANPDAKKVFNNKVAVAMALANDANFTTADSGRLLLGLVNTTGKPAESLELAKDMLSDTSSVTSQLLSGAATAAQSTLTENQRMLLSRLYVALLGRAPDQNGLAYYMEVNPGDAASWANIASNMLIQPGATTGANNADFVRAVYQRAFGTVPTSAEAAAEVQGFVDQLNHGATKAQVAVAMMDSMLAFANLSPIEQTWKAGFNNKATVGLVFALDLKCNDAQVAKKVVELVDSQGVSEALSYAFANARSGLVASTSGVRSGAAESLPLIDTLLAANSVGYAPRTPVTAPADEVAMSLYVGLMGRTASSFAVDADLEAFITMAGNEGGALEMAKLMLASQDGHALYPDSMDGAAFVGKLLDQTIGAAVRPAPYESWVASYSLASRASLATQILNWVYSYREDRPNESALVLLQSKADFMDRVAAALTSIETLANNLRKKQADIITQAQSDIALVNKEAGGDAVKIFETAKSAMLAALGSTAGDGSAARRVRITLIYTSILGRAPRASEVDWWISRGATDYDVILGAIQPGGEAYYAYNFNNMAYVRMMYENILHRTEFKQEEFEFWYQSLSGGPLGFAPIEQRARVAETMFKNYWDDFSDYSATQLQVKAQYDDKLRSALQEVRAWQLADKEGYHQENLDKATSDYVKALSNAENARLALVDATNTYEQARQNKIDGETLLAGNYDAAGYVLTMLGLPNSYLDILNAVKAGRDPASYLRERYSSTAKPTAETVTAIFQLMLHRSPSADDIRFYTAAGVTEYSAAWDVMWSLESKSVNADRINDANNAAIRVAKEAIAYFNNCASVLDSAQKDIGRTEDAVAAALAAKNAAQAVVDRDASIVLALDAGIASMDKVKIADGLAINWGKIQGYNKIIKTASELQAKRTLQASDAHTAAQVATGESNAAKASILFSKSRGAFDVASPTAKKTMLVVELYQAMFGKRPTVSALAYWVSRMPDISSGLNATAPVVAEMLNTPEAQGLLASSDVDFINGLYRKALGREADGPGLDFWLSNMPGSGVSGRAQLVVSFINGISEGSALDALVLYGNAKNSMVALSGELTAIADGIFTGVNYTDYESLLEAAARDPKPSPDPALNQQEKYVRQIASLYISIHGRAPDVAGAAHWMKQTLSMEDMATQMLQSEEGAKVWGSLSGEAFLSAFYERCYDRPLTNAERAAIAAGSNDSRGKIAAAVLAYGAKMTVDSSATAVSAHHSLASKVAAALDNLYDEVQAQKDPLANAFTLAGDAIAAKPEDRHLDSIVQGIDTMVNDAKRKGSTVDKIKVDRWGNAVEIRDARDTNWVTKFSYNFDNQVASASRPNDYGQPAAQTSYRYDALGRNISTTDARGFTTKHYYNSYGFLTREANADGSSTNYEVNSFGQVTTLTEANGVAWSLKYDPEGNLYSKTSVATTKVFKPKFDANSRLMLLTDADAQNAQLLEQYGYDELGRRISTTTTTVGGSDSIVERATYDLNSNLVKSTNGLAHATRYAYDSQNRKVVELDAIGGKKEWRYNGENRVESHTDLGGHTIHYTYSAAGQLRTQTSTSAAGQPQQDRVFAYDDASGRLTRIDDRAIAQVSTYGYDSAGERIFERSIQDNILLQDQALKYDAQGRVKHIKSNVAGADYEIDYVFDENGNKKDEFIRFTTQDGDLKDITVNRSFDKMNREERRTGTIKTTTGGQGGSVPPVLVSLKEHALTYDGNGQRLTDRYDGVSDQYAYDSVGRLATVKRGDVVTLTNSYDYVGNLVQSTETDAATKLGETRVSAFDSTGNLIRQQTFSRESILNEATRHYDDAGRLSDLDIYGTFGVKLESHTFAYEGSYQYDEYLASKETITKGAGSPIDVRTELDVNGHVGATYRNGEATGEYFTDANGNALLKDRSNNGGGMHSLVVNGETIGRSDGRTQSFAVGISTATDQSGSSGSEIYTVQAAGETLRSIAQRVWGDSSLWYLISQVNPDCKTDDILEIGRLISIPPRTENANSQESESNVRDQYQKYIEDLHKYSAYRFSGDSWAAFSSGSASYFPTMMELQREDSALGWICGTGDPDRGVGEDGMWPMNLYDEPFGSLFGGTYGSVVDDEFGINSYDAVSDAIGNAFGDAFERGLGDAIGDAFGNALESSLARANWGGSAGLSDSSGASGNSNPVAGGTISWSSSDDKSWSRSFSYSNRGVQFSGQDGPPTSGTELGELVRSSTGHGYDNSSITPDTDPARIAGYDSRFGPGQAVIVTDKITGDRIACWRSPDGVCSLPAVSASSTTQSVNPIATPSQDNWLGKVVGSVVETPLAIASGVIGGIVGSIYGVGATLFSGKYGTQEGIQIGQQAGSELAQKITMTPSTNTGRTFVETIGGWANDSGIGGLGFPELNALGSRATSTTAALRNLPAARAGAAAPVYTAPTISPIAVSSRHTSWGNSLSQVSGSLERLGQRALQRSGGDAQLAEKLFEKYANGVDNRLKRTGSEFGIEVQPAALKDGTRVPNFIYLHKAGAESPLILGRNGEPKLYAFPGSRRLDLGVVNTAGVENQHGLYPVVAGFDITLNATKPNAVPYYQKYFGNIPIYDIRLPK